MKKPNIEYSHFRIKKRKNSYRNIYAPSEELKAYQNYLLRKLYLVSPHKVNHGFIPNKSIVTNALPHVGKNWVLSLDISNFFPSTTKPKLVKIIDRFYPNQKENIDYFLYKNHIPQGAPTSPYLANFALYDFDEQLNEYCVSEDISYTRYADDLTFSYNATSLKSLLIYINTLISEYGYRINRRKTKIMPKHKRQIVTGIIVNEKINIPKNIKNLTRALKHVSKKQDLKNYSEEWLSGMNGYESMIKI